MKFNRFWILVAAALSVMFSGQARAAEPCYGLNAADCALLTAAGSPAALAKLNAFALVYEAALVIDGGRAERDIVFSAEGSGAVALDTDALARLRRGDLNGGTGALAMTVTTKANLKMPDLDRSGLLELRILNSTLYAKGDALTANQWRFAELRNLITREGNARAGLTALLRLGRVAAALGTFRADAAGLVTGARLSDIVQDGQKVAVFKFTLNIPGLLADKALFPLIKSGLELGGEAVKDADLQELLAIFGAYARNLNITYTRWVGVADALPRGIGIDATGTLDPVVFTPLAGGGGPQGSDAKPLIANLHFLVRLSNIGQPPSISLPQGALPFESGSGT